MKTVAIHRTFLFGHMPREQEAHHCRSQNHWHVLPTQSILSARLELLIGLITMHQNRHVVYVGALPKTMITIADYIRTSEPETVSRASASIYIPQLLVGCNYLHMTTISVSGTNVHIYEIFRRTIPYAFINDNG